MIRKWAKFLGNVKTVSMPQACIPRSVEGSEQADLSSPCPACRVLEFTLTNLSKFPPTLRFCGTNGDGSQGKNSMLTFSQWPEVPRSKSKNTMNKKLKSRDAEDWTRNISVTLEGRISIWDTRSKLLHAYHSVSLFKTWGGLICLNTFSWNLAHFTSSFSKYSLSFFILHPDFLITSCQLLLQDALFLPIT